MIIKGKSRAGGRALGAYLSRQGENERVQVLEVRGTVARDPLGAILEMDAYALGTRCGLPLYHAIISPAPNYVLTPEQRMECVEALEARLGYTGHARVVVAHLKNDREHLHIVWSRIDLQRMRAVSDSHNYRKHEEVARDLERRFGHDRVQGAHHERDGVERPGRSPSRSELRQEERTGVNGKEVTAEVTRLFRQSDGPEAFIAALEQAGYLVAKGDRRDYCLVDAAGGTHNLARRIEGVKAAELRMFMAPLDRDAFPSVEQAQQCQRDRGQGERSSRDEIAWQDTLAKAAIEQARRQHEDEWRRRLEKRADHADNRIEAAYARGDDYVSQATAARRDHKRRQKNLNRQAEAQSAGREGRDGSPASSAASRPAAPGVEMTDEMRARFERLLGSMGDGRSREGPDRQQQGPGGGRSRTR